MTLFCDKCGQSSPALYRANEVGMVPALWYCEACLQTPIDPETKELIDLIAPPRETTR
jgi:hypothetical protein